ncbi:hypothetical protein MUO14_13260 [Halobacillus shinanisalinarum]|uniref:DUF5683 domain-containing protein n=1 Tax=Halobacillus shinanisalinarum TaxID=2932258 RepID=A0ABY4GVY5_9BACI|nr:hypothetical protein [Halobacillus shinanisalinarum]UOQ91547.1 hypothetical protein MUO14_13260 [Halobacillus shinanisalinarum]
MKNYQSPWAALLWSFALPGFGQLYNRDYIIAFTLIALELIINYLSNLNLSILHTFHGHFAHSHSVVKFQHGLFYPSIWGFSMWQAFNKAKRMNGDGSKVYLTGLLFGLVAGMNISLFAHHILPSPVYSGLATGVIGAAIGNIAEKLINKVRNK